MPASVRAILFRSSTEIELFYKAKKGFHFSQWKPSKGTDLLALKPIYLQFLLLLSGLVIVDVSLFL